MTQSETIKAIEVLNQVIETHMKPLGNSKVVEQARIKLALLMPLLDGSPETKKARMCDCGGSTGECTTSCPNKYYRY